MKGIWHADRKVVSTLLDEDLLTNQVVTKNYYLFGVKVSSGIDTTINNIENTKSSKKVGFGK